MGEFKAGTTLIWLTIYFFGIIVILHGTVVMANHYNVNHSISYEDTGFGSNSIDTQYNFSVDNTNDLENANSFADTIGFALGFSNSIDINLPSEYEWIFRFILIYIPGILFILGLYFILPFLH